MKKALKLIKPVLTTIGEAMIVAGIFLLLTTVDDSESQIWQMLVGLSLLGGGALLTA